MIRKEVGIYIRVGGWDICQTLALLGNPTNEISLFPKDKFIPIIGHVMEVVFRTQPHYCGSVE